MLNYANTEEKAKRVKYVRALEKFIKSAVATLKREDFEYERFKERVYKNYKSQLQKIEPAMLDSSYTKALENFANTTMRVLSHPSEDKNEDRQALLRHANALEKLKTNLSYKKEKHPKKIYNDGY